MTTQDLELRNRPPLHLEPKMRYLGQECHLCNVVTCQNLHVAVLVQILGPKTPNAPNFSGVSSMRLREVNIRRLRCQLRRTLPTCLTGFHYVSELRRCRKSGDEWDKECP